MLAEVDDLFGDLTAQLQSEPVPERAPEPLPPGVDSLGWGFDDLVDNPVVAWGSDPGDPLKQAVDLVQGESVVQRVDPKEGRYLRDPVLWARDRLAVELWSKQRTIIESVRDNPRTAVHTCHTIGKSFSSAVTVLWWIDVHPPGTAFVVTTAPTAAQVRAILWREINRLHARGRLQGRVNLTNEWYLGNELVAMGRKPPDYKDDAFQGIHARYVLCVFDEACGIPRQMWDAASTLVSNEESRFLAIGNPDDPTTMFGEVCGASPRKLAAKNDLDGSSLADDVPDDGIAEDASSWSVVHVSAFDTPNFTGERVSDHVKASLVSPRWVAEREIVWGANSPIYKSKVLGKFSVDVDAGVIPYTWAAACASLDLPEGMPVTAGLDVGGDGSDRTVLRERRGAKAGRERIWQAEGDTVALAAEVARQLTEWGCTSVVVDAIGVGHGMVSELKRTSTRHQATVVNQSSLLHDCEVVPFKGSESPSSDEFLNARSELYWMGREKSRLKLWDLAEVDDDTLAELCAPTYDVVPGSSKIRIEGKKELKKRFGASPDRAEALLLAFWEKTMTMSLPVPAQIFTQRRWDRPESELVMVGPVSVPPDPEAMQVQEEVRKAEEDLMRTLLRDRALLRPV